MVSDADPAWNIALASLWVQTYNSIFYKIYVDWDHLLSFVFEKICFYAACSK